MPDITWADLESNVNDLEILTAIDALGTAPTISPSGFLHGVAMGYRKTQNQYNVDAGTGPYLGTVGFPVPIGNLQTDTNGDSTQEIGYEVRIIATMSSTAGVVARETDVII